METILSYIDDIDTSIDFCKIGGLFILLPCLTSKHVNIRNMSASIIAELSQNNPYCQKELLELDALPKLLTLLNEEQTAVNGQRAISSLIRSYEPCLRTFISIGGLECLLECLHRPQEKKLITKTAFLLRSLCNDFPYIRDKFIKLKAVELIIPLILPHCVYDVCLETLLSALCSLTENRGKNDQCCTQNFKATLEEIVNISTDKPECAEIVEYARSLLKNINF